VEHFDAQRKSRLASLLATAVLIVLAAASAVFVALIPKPEPVVFAEPDAVTSPTAEPSAQSGDAALIALLMTEIIRTDSSFSEQTLVYCGREFGAEPLEAVLSAILDGSYAPELWYELTGHTLHVLNDLSSGAAASDPRIHNLGDNGKDTFTLGFTGDINLDDTLPLFTHYLSSGGLSDCLSPELIRIMNDMDVMFVNNEFTFSNGGKAQANKPYTFRSKPENVGMLKELGVDIVSTANNHIYDFGLDAFNDTFQTLDGAGIAHVGAGANLEEASAAVYYIINGRKIAYVAAGDTAAWLMTPAATDESPGILPVQTKDETVAAIQAAKAQSDHVFVYPHWGPENTNWFSETQRNLGRAFIDAGADAVIGAHPHVLQGMEFYSGKLIAYSLGNFWFNVKTMNTGLLELSVDRQGMVTPVFYPCVQSGGKTQLKTDPAEREAIFKFVERICPGGSIDIKDDGTIFSNN